MRREVILGPRSEPMPRKKVIKLGSQDITVYSIGWFAYVARISRQTIRLWEAKKILPRPLLNISGNRRFYTPSEILVYASDIDNHYAGGRDLNLLRSTFRTNRHRLHGRLAAFMRGTPIPKNEQSLPVNIERSTAK